VISFVFGSKATIFRGGNFILTGGYIGEIFRVAVVAASLFGADFVALRFGVAFLGAAAARVIVPSSRDMRPSLCMARRTRRTNPTPLDLYRCFRYGGTCGSTVANNSISSCSANANTYAAISRCFAAFPAGQSRSCPVLSFFAISATRSMWTVQKRDSAER